MKKIFLALPLLALLVIGSLEAKPAKKSKSSKTTTTATTTPTKVEYGKTLPAWSEGCLDIHFINSGRGECCFYILPDGTTLLVDAGEVADSETSVPQRPNAETKPYITYARYIQHFSGHERCAVCSLTTNHRGWISSWADEADDVQGQYNIVADIKSLNEDEILKMLDDLDKTPCYLMRKDGE